MTGQADIHEVDIDKAEAALKFMAKYIRNNVDEITKAENVAKEPLMGLILTAIHTGLITNASKQTTELRNKIMMAFDIGYFHGKLGAGEK
ncbi:hypothetical protein LCGC14_0541370 [marine sediment metagenome]|uniref:Uncharacterized protein n=1 Tax=marine sediment metagenome TaxID=412755 RepID=A0A0F9V0Y9_9ZZZZ